MTRWRLTLGDAEALADALARRLTGRHLDRLWRPTDATLLLRLSGEKKRLLVDTDPRTRRVTFTERWPPTPAAPDRETLGFRGHLEGARITGVACVDERALVFRLERGDGPRTLRVQLAGRYPNAAVFDGEGALLQALWSDRPPADPESPPLRAGAAGDGAVELPDDWLARFDARAWAASDAIAVRDRATSIGRDLRTRRKRLKRRADAVERDLERAEGADAHRHHGELLKTALHRAEKGDTAVTVADWSRPDGGEVEVPLDPELTPVENMERYFGAYRKLSRARDGIETRLLATVEELEAVEGLLGRVDGATDLPPGDAMAALDAAEAEIGQRGWLRKRQRRSRRRDDVPALPYREFRAADGTPILVGRSSRHNDDLTFRVAKGNDLWLHARDAAGSHVVVRRQGKAEVSGETLLDAAMLAAWHSKLRGDTVVEVMWTERKHVSKPKHAPPGRVTAADTRNVGVRNDPERLAGIYRRSGYATPDTA